MAASGCVCVVVHPLLGAPALCQISSSNTNTYETGWKQPSAASLQLTHLQRPSCSCCASRIRGIYFGGGGGGTQSRPGYPLTGSHRDGNGVISKEPEASSSERHGMEREQGKYPGRLEYQWWADDSMFACGVSCPLICIQAGILCTLRTSLSLACFIGTTYA